MSISYSLAMRDAGLDAMVAVLGSSAVLKLLSGSLPASLSSPETGVPLIVFTLAATWGTQPAGGGVKNLANVPIVAATAGIGGTAGYFRLYDGNGTPHMQGTVTALGGGGDLQINNVIVPGVPVSVTSWTLTDGNSS